MKLLTCCLSLGKLPRRTAAITSPVFVRFSEKTRANDNRSVRLAGKKLPATNGLALSAGGRIDPQGVLIYLYSREASGF